MGLTMEQQKAVASQIARRYRQASKKKKGQIIEEYMGLTGCTRHHAAWLLRCWGTTVWDRHDGQLVKIVVGQRRRRQLPNRFFFVGLLLGLAIAAGAVLTFPFSASRVLAYAFRLHGWERAGLPVPRFPERPPVGILNQRLQRLDGSEVSLSEFQHKILFVNYWATWCAPCVEEMPSIESLAERFLDADVAFLLISEEPADTVCFRFAELTAAQQR